VGFEDQIDDIMREAYDNINQEGLNQELEDFIKIEEFFASKDAIDDSSTEIWYLVLNTDDELTIVNSEIIEDDSQVLAIRYKETYGDLYTALYDEDMIRECKADGCVGIITRSEVWASKIALDLDKNAADCEDKVTMHLTTLTTPRGVHIITRQGDNTDEVTYAKSKIKQGESKLVDALIAACFHW